MVKFNLDSVIRELMLEMGENNENKYARMLQHGISGLREFNFDLAQGSNGVPTSVILPVNDNLTVNLPADYINYVRIGILDNLGNLLQLGLNNDMRHAGATNACGNPVNYKQSTVPNVNTITYPALEEGGGSLGQGTLVSAFLTWDGYADNFRNGELTGRFFGIGGGTNPYGYYRIDMEKGQILLGSVGACEIFLEYLSDLQLINGEYFVHPYMVEALKCYIYWKMNSRNERKSGLVKQESRHEYYNELDRAKARFNQHSVTEWMSAFRFSNKASPRF